ncbi:MAG: phosphoenolpyruvate--protein phosphotransferase [Deltaproteobacteria bacterium]|jgi:phosphotransferase system enzyme I (PtsI)|nr:phosphoenolpyruvate--protein phosphotransferase [Deltaproteobacteria bacterium]
MLLPPPFVPASSVFKGIGVGTAAVQGEAFVLGGLNVIRSNLPDDEAVTVEVERFLQAVDSTSAKFKAAKAILPRGIAGQDEEIFEIYLALLKEPFLQKHTISLIHQEKINAEAALLMTLDLIQEIMGSRVATPDPYIKRRGEDVAQLVHSLLKSLSGREEPPENFYPQGCVVVAKEMTPAEVVALPRDRVAGLVTENGGRTSHTALLAQALEIPAVMGVSSLVDKVTPGLRLILDAVEGHVILDPDYDAQAFYRTRELALATFHREIVRVAHIPSRTLDDRRVEIHANLELLEELPAVTSYGAEGIGLYRTEMVYLSRDCLPTEEELFESYRRVVTTIHPREVTIRTLDLGADKMPAAFGRQFEGQNQALGLRAIRFCLKYPDVFRAQLRAILRASATGNTRVMLPMISTLEEIDEVKSLLLDTRRELVAEGHRIAPALPVGIMVEVPAAVVMAREMAQKADFFSIGTNDLIQYSMALDRTNPEVKDLYQPLNPSILRMIKMVIDAGKEARIPVSICGGMAADPVAASLLIGLGADMLSMPYYNIPVIKRLVRMSFFEDIQKVTREALQTTSSRDAEALVREFLRDKLADAQF